MWAIIYCDIRLHLGIIIKVVAESMHSGAVAYLDEGVCREEGRGCPHLTGLTGKSAQVGISYNYNMNLLEFMNSRNLVSVTSRPELLSSPTVGTISSVNMNG